MKLAIVIPAYKRRYLRESLEAIRNQTDRRFHLYIGDDGSPEELKDIVEETTVGLDCTYHRFPDNLGGRDLVAHWERCIALSNDEEWIWLFSDDDLADPNCVANFYEALAFTREYFDIYRFPSYWIDQDSRVLIPREEVDVLPFESVESFAQRRHSGRLHVCAQDHIFRRATYVEFGFVNFPLAWGTDVATWMRFARRKGFCTVPDAWVAFRFSGDNLSSIEAPGIALTKIRATADYTAWLGRFFRVGRAERSVRRTFYEVLLRHTYAVTGANISLLQKIQGVVTLAFQLFMRPWLVPEFLFVAAALVFQNLGRFFEKRAEKRDRTLPS